MHDQPSPDPGPAADATHDGATPTMGPVPAGAEIEDRIAIALRRIFRGVELHSGELASSCGLTGPQLALLRTIERQHVATIASVSRSMHLSHATVSGIVDRVAARGLIERVRRTDDRRSVSLTLTEAGIGLLQAAPPLLPERLRRALTSAPEWDRLHVLAILERVGAMMDEP